MSHVLTTATYFLAGVIHLLPVTGILGSSQLERLYGVVPTNPDLLILMRHRAALFGVVGAILLWAAWHPDVRPIAAPVGLLSMGSYLVLATGSTNPALGRVWWIDAVLFGALLIAYLGER